MPELSNKWLKCYEQLAELSRKLQDATRSEHWQSILNLCREINTQLQQLTDEHFGATVAQLAINVPDYPITTRRAIKSWVLLALLCRLKHWPDPRRDTLGICVLLASCAVTSSKVPAALSIAQQLKHLKMGGVLTTILAGCYHLLQKRQAWQVHHDSPLLTLALDLAAQLQPTTAEAIALEDVLAVRISETQSEFELEQLGQLAQLAPALYLCGRVAQDPQARFWLLCQYDGEGYQALPFWPEQHRIGEQLSYRAMADLTVQAPATLLPNTWLDKIQLPPITHYATPTPSSLLQHSILPKLSHHNIDAQLALLEQQPIIVQFLLDNASESNRKQTTIHRLRHALAIFGQTQLPVAVARAEIAHYLQLQGSNQHAWLHQLQQCLHYALLLFGKHLPDGLGDQQAGLIAACCSAPLWHHPSVQAVPLSKTHQHQLLVGQLCQQYLLEPVRSQRFTAALLQHYQQHTWAEAALRQYQTSAPDTTVSSTTQLAFVLRISWQLTFSVFCYPSAQQSTHELLQRAASILSLPEANLSYWQQAMLECSALYYPLP